MSRDSERRALDFCRATCPAVDGVLSDWISDNRELIPPALSDKLEALVEAIKDVGTVKLRAALEEACGELIEAEGKVTDLERQVSDLERRVDYLKDELAQVDA